MNKYFLSLITILILFQGFKVFDIIFFKEKEYKKGYIVIPPEKENLETQINLTDDSKKDVTPKIKINFTELFAQAKPQNGKKISKPCLACHDFSSSQKNKIGPPLWKVVDRQVASIKNFKYSGALIEYKKNWSREELFYFLENPKNYIKGTKMVYKGLKKVEDRVDIISYLETLK